MRYYDMKKNPPVCPGCGTAFDAEQLSRSRRGRISAEDKAALKQRPLPEDLDDIPPLPDDDADNLIEDVDELGETDVEDVVDVETDEMDRS